MQKNWLPAMVAALVLCPGWAQAEDYVISLKDHQFSPQELAIPVNQKIRLTVKNLDASPAEFESSDVNREKIVGANSEIAIFIGPLDSGMYHYFDDFHRESTGTIIVK